MTDAAQKILICMHDFSRGGTERVAIGLAARWAGMGRDVTILCGSDEGGLRGMVDPRVKTVTLSPRMRRGFTSRFRLGRAMRAHVSALDPDIVFLPGNFHFFLAGAMRKAVPRAAIVLKISNPPVPRGIMGALTAPFFRRFTRAVDGFAAMSTGLARDMNAILPRRTIVTLRDPMLAGGGHAVSSGGGAICNIVWAGRLEPQKDIGLALRTIRALAATRPAHLTVLGDGAERRWMLRAIKRMGLTGQVTWAGHVPDIIPYLAHADALLVTSRYEGGPAVAVEALAWNVPVIATDCSHMLRDILIVPEAGRIVDSRVPEHLASALSAVLDEPRPLPGRLPALVSGFEAEYCARAYLQWFDALVARKSL